MHFFWFIGSIGTIGIFFSPLVLGEMYFIMGLRGFQGYFIDEMHLSTRRDVCLLYLVI